MFQKLYLFLVLLILSYTATKRSHKDPIMISPHGVEYFVHPFDSTLSAANMLIKRMRKYLSICRQQLVGDMTHIEILSKDATYAKKNTCQTVTNNLCLWKDATYSFIPHLMLRHQQPITVTNVIWDLECHHDSSQKNSRDVEMLKKISIRNLTTIIKVLVRFSSGGFPYGVMAKTRSLVVWRVSFNRCGLERRPDKVVVCALYRWWCGAGTEQR